jgi:hypothetical protein
MGTSLLVTLLSPRASNFVVNGFTVHLRTRTGSSPACALLRGRNSSRPPQSDLTAYASDCRRVSARQEKYHTRECHTPFTPAKTSRVRSMNTRCAIGLDFTLGTARGRGPFASCSLHYRGSFGGHIGSLRRYTTYAARKETGSAIVRGCFSTDVLLVAARRTLVLGRLFG